MSSTGQTRPGTPWIWTASLPSPSERRRGVADQSDKLGLRGFLHVVAPLVRPLRGHDLPCGRLSRAH